MDAWLWLLKRIYPITEPQIQRDRPLEILCLGLSRSATESLSKALVQLGYDECYHGLQIVEYRIADSAQWYRLTKAKEQGNDKFLCREQFDRILGHCRAVTDCPSCCFGPELMRCYPEAKVILNRRKDVAAWEQSIRSTLFGMYDSWWAWFQSFFERDLFWIRLWTLGVAEPLLIHPLQRNPDKMKELYEEHYTTLKEVCRTNDREYLEWTVEDGWGPLCKYLGKDVPQTAFPEGNSGADFAKFKTRILDPRLKRARKNMILAAISGSSVLLAAGMQVWSKAFK